MDILSLLPLLEGWVWEAKDVDVPIVVPAGKEKVMARIAGRGWVWSAAVAFSSEKASIDVLYDDYLHTSSTPEGVHGFGLTYPNASGIFCPVYTALPPVYGIAFLPVNPMAFHRKVILTLRNPTAANITVYNYAHLLIVIDDKDAFLKSLREIGLYG